jgi:hypothetical protein
MVRHRKPRRIVEVSAGSTTRTMAAAVEKNAVETGQRPELVTIYPSPYPFFDQIPSRVRDSVDLEVIRSIVQVVCLDVFRRQEDNDILFVDSSHVFKTASDVEWEFLQVYPILQSGMAVHIHDIFFPFDYLRQWNDKDYRFWNEQYFLDTVLQYRRLSYRPPARVVPDGSSRVGQGWQFGAAVDRPCRT